ncbi:hypothetical protein [Mangrovicoccus ximenensis]|nr:hypothetical protein [Mangrovicoccus ximenensis]
MDSAAEETGGRITGIGLIGAPNCGTTLPVNARTGASQRGGG